MTPEEYRAKAALLDAQARDEGNAFTQAELQRLAAGFRRLAEQAERNSKTDVVYEPSPVTARDQQTAQQQQQPQAEPTTPTKDTAT